MNIIIGATCSGKTKIVDELVKRGYNKIVTYTTRPKRDGEVDGKDYHFVSEDYFLSKVRNNFFAEYKEYDTAFGKWYYGVSYDSIENSTEKDIIILTPSGVTDLKQRFSSDKMNILYVYANQKTIKKRSEKRGEYKGEKKLEAIRRLEQDRIDFKNAELLADRIFYNNFDTDLNEVVDKIVTYLEEKNEK